MEYARGRKLSALLSGDRPDIAPPLVSQLYETGFRLGECLVEPAKSTIVNSRGPQRVEPRVMDVLVALTRYAGQTVPRDKLINEVWSTSYVSDEVLSRCISLLRRHLEDDRRNPRYIETIPKRGYRLVTAILEPVDSEADEIEPSPSPNAYESIAVLPFVNLSNDPGYEYFSDGITEELLNLLAKIDSLKVAARTSSFSFKDKNVDIRLVGKELGVDTALMGSVRHSGEHIRVSAQLLDTSNGFHLWSEIYQRPATDLFVLQVDLSRAIVNALRLAIGKHDELVDSILERNSPTADMDAYHLHLQGKYHWHRRGEESIRKSIALCRKACARDPNFAQAHLTLAKAYSVLPFYSNEPREASFKKGQAAARGALELDGSLGEAHAVLGFTNMHLWNWKAAGHEYHLALNSVPNDPSTHQWYAQFLTIVGFPEKSYEHILIARDLDPISSPIYGRLAVTYFHQHRNDLAEEHFRIADALGDARRTLIEADIALKWRLGNKAETEQLFAELQRGLNLDDEWLNALLEAIREPDRRDALLQRLASPQFGAGLSIVFGVAVLMGKVDFAYGVADRLIADKTLLVEFLLTPEAEPLRRDPRFRGLLKQVGLYDYWESTGWPDSLS